MNKKELLKILNKFSKSMEEVTCVSEYNKMLILQMKDRKRFCVIVLEV